MAAVEINEKNFPKEVTYSSLPVLVDFYADWCAPCRSLSAVLESLSTEFDGKVKIGKVNVGTQPDLAERYHIQSVPTMLVFRGGKVTDTLIGAVGKEQIRNLVGVQ